MPAARRQPAKQRFLRRVGIVMKYLRENVDALDVMLNADDLERIDEVAPKDVAAGSRYPEAMMRLLGK